MKIANIKIGVRLGASHALLLALLAGVALCGVRGLTRANDALHHIADVNTHKISCSKPWKNRPTSWPA